MHLEDFDPKMGPRRCLGANYRGQHAEGFSCTKPGLRGRAQSHDGLGLDVAIGADCDRPGYFLCEGDDRVRAGKLLEIDRHAIGAGQGHSIMKAHYQGMRGSARTGKSRLAARRSPLRHSARLSRQDK